MKKLLLLMMVAVLVIACQKKQEMAKDFVKVENGHFVRGGKPYYYVGTNFWYGAILGSEGQGGDRARLGRELDEMKRMGIDNLRILVGSDGERGVKTKVEPTLQIAPGVYNDTILAGLDYLLMEMGKRDMVAVLYLNNSWEWSGGYGFYLEHAGEGKQPRPDEAGYPAFMQAMAKYATNEKAHQLFYDYVRFIIGRTNRYTNVKYTDDPAIMSWQIGNEPRAFSKEALPAFEKWLAEASALIRSLDKNHLISVGSEGSWGCENDLSSWSRICADENIDYCNVLDVDRKNEEALLYRAYIYTRRRSYKEARIDYNTLLQKLPEHRMGRLGLALLDQKEMRYREASEIFNRLLEDDPNDTSILKARANLELEMELPDMALLDVNNVIRLTPNDAEAYLMKGDIYLVLKKKKDANKAYDKAVSLGIPRPEVLNRMKEQEN